MRRRCSACGKVKDKRGFFASTHYHCKKCRLVYQRANREEASRRARKHELKRKYGLTLEQYDAMLEAAGGRCECCGKEWHRKLYVDHCHTTGKVRGLLCATCNVAIGMIETHPDIMDAFDYLSQRS